MGITLKAARVNKNLTQKQAADKIGVSKETLGNWERGISFPDIKRLKEIESAYNISYDKLIFLPNNYT